MSSVVNWHEYLAAVVGAAGLGGWGIDRNVDPKILLDHTSVSWCLPSFRTMERT